MNTNNKFLSKYLSLFLLATIIFYFTFSSIFNSHFITADQFRTFCYGLNKYPNFLEIFFKEIQYYISTGRPIVYIGEIIEHLYASEVKDFYLFRFVSLILMICSILVFTHILEKIFSNLWTTFFLVCSFFCLPPIVFVLMQGGTAMMIHISLILSGLSYLILPEELFFKNSKKNIKKLGIFFILFFLRDRKSVV